MSYCRWSCSNFRSHAYAYEDCAGGFTIHVAAYKVVGEIPPAASLSDMLRAEPSQREQAIADMVKAHADQMAFLASAPRERIGKVYDGETHHFDTLEEALEFMLHLRAVGYFIPEFAINAMRYELRENAREAA